VEKIKCKIPVLYWILKRTLTDINGHLQTLADKSAQLSVKVRKSLFGLEYHAWGIILNSGSFRIKIQ
jgi:hypothetical protein